MKVKDNIILISDRLFRRFGIRGVTIDDICSEGGISKKTVYLYFKDKHSVAKSSIDFYHNNLFSQIKKIVDDSSNSIESLIMISRKFRETLYATAPILINDLKNSEIYKDVINNFPDAELVNVKSKDKGNENDWF